MAVVNRLRQLRKERALTQRDVARLSGVSFVTVGRLDRDVTYKTTIANAERIAAALGVGMGELFVTLDEPPAEG